MNINNINYYTLDIDEVIEGYVVTGSTTYDAALNYFVPLISRLDMQRDIIKTKFYERLEADILRGCVMPPITIALIHPFQNRPMNNQGIFDFINSNIQDGFVLDGIQRLNILIKASENLDFDRTRSIHVNFVLTNSRDRLLYRMITLNNGQRRMSARHQIDVLADTFFEFDHLNIKLVAEKKNTKVKTPDSFRKADFVKGYIAYLSNSVNVDNQKIIEEKMDELIASRIIESDIPTSKMEFSDVVELLNRISEEEKLLDWIRIENNFIGFCVGIKKSLHVIELLSNEQIRKSVENFEKAFTAINVSKVNVGKVRRESVSKYIENFETVIELDEFSMLDKITGWI